MKKEMKNFSIILNPIIRDSKITDAAFRTYVVLKTFQFTLPSGQTNPFPSQATIAKIRGKSKKSIISHLKMLKSLGLISYKKRGYSASNMYHFIGEEKYTIDSGNTEDNYTSKVKETSHLSLQKLQPNNNEINNTKTNNNVENKKDWELGRKRIDEIRRKMSHLFKAKKG